MSRRAAMRSSTGGWVMNNFINQLVFCFPLYGESINKELVASFVTFIGVRSEEIFSKALAKPSGYLVNKAPSASAKNSRFLEIASCTKVAAIGATIAATIHKTIKIAPGFPLSSYDVLL